MRKLVLFLVLTISFGATLAAAAAESQTPNVSKIDWQTSMDEAIQQAKAQNRLILMDFFNPE
jgi:hypothetical protein